MRSAPPSARRTTLRWPDKINCWAKLVARATRGEFQDCVTQSVPSAAPLSRVRRESAKRSVSTKHGHRQSTEKPQVEGRIRRQPIKVKHPLYVPLQRVIWAKA